VAFGLGVFSGPTLYHTLQRRRLRRGFCTPHGAVAVLAYGLWLHGIAQQGMASGAPAAHRGFLDSCRSATVSSYNSMHGYGARSRLGVFPMCVAHFALVYLLKCLFGRYL